MTEFVRKKEVFKFLRSSRNDLLIPFPEGWPNLGQVSLTQFCKSGRYIFNDAIKGYFKSNHILNEVQSTIIPLIGEELYFNIPIML